MEIFSFGTLEVGGYFLKKFRSTEELLAIYSTFQAMSYTFYGSNLFLLLCSNTRFYDEFKTIVNFVHFIAVVEKLF